MHVYTHTYTHTFVHTSKPFFSLTTAVTEKCSARIQRWDCTWAFCFPLMPGSAKRRVLALRRANLVTKHMHIHIHGCRCRTQKNHVFRREREKKKHTHTRSIYLPISTPPLLSSYSHSHHPNPQKPTLTLPVMQESVSQQPTTFSLTRTN